MNKEKSRTTFDFAGWKWIIISFCVAIIIGVICASVSLFAKDDNSSKYVSTSIALTWNGASNGKAPNGQSFNFLKIDNSEILQKSIEECEINISTEELRKGLLITGIYSDNTIEELKNTTSILESETITIKNSNYVPTVYNIAIYPKECGLSISEAEKLVKEIAENYELFMLDIYVLRWNEEIITEILDINEADYIDALTILQYRLNVITETANRYNQIDSNFQSDGHYFSDIAVQANQIIANELATTMSKCNVNMLSKDKKALEQRYRYIIRDKELELAETEKVLDSINDLEKVYHRDSSLYVSNGTGLSFVKGNSNETYEQIVASKVRYAETKSLLQAEIEYYQGRVEVITKSNENSATYKNDCETVSAEIKSIYQKELKLEETLKAYIKDFNATNLDESKISIGAVTVVKPRIISFSFIKQLIKCCGPFVTLVLIFWLSFGFVIKVKNDKLNAKK